jgi:hypothetical protein
LKKGIWQTQFEYFGIFDDSPKPGNPKPQDIQYIPLYLCIEQGSNVGIVASTRFAN